MTSVLEQWLSQLVSFLWGLPAVIILKRSIPAKLLRTRVKFVKVGITEMTPNDDLSCDFYHGRTLQPVLAMSLNGTIFVYTAILPPILPPRFSPATATTYR